MSKEVTIAAAEASAAAKTSIEGSALLSARNARGLSREVLAATAGVSPRTIYAIEVEGVCPQRATRTVIALALGLPVEHVFPRGRPA